MHLQKGRLAQEHARDGGEEEDGRQGEEEEEAVHFFDVVCWWLVKSDGCVYTYIHRHTVGESNYHCVRACVPLGAAGWCAASATVRRRGEKPRRNLSYNQCQ